MVYTVKKGHAISEVDPGLVCEWDYKKNVLTPDEVSYGSGKHYYWICKKCNSSYPATPNKRHHGRGCPYCAGQKVKKGYNDLATVMPILAKEWDYSRNDKSPDEVTARGGGPAYWKCSVCGHEWGPVNISDRYRGTGCPQCKKSFHTSLAEQIIFYYIKKCFPDAVNSYKPNWIGKFSEIDIFVPSLLLAIEYDGEYWHKKKAVQDQKKGLLIKEHGISLIRVREGDLPELQDGSEVLAIPLAAVISQEQETVVKRLFSIINGNYCLEEIPDIDIIRDYPTIISFIKADQKSKSLAHLHPELLADWDYNMNGSMRPEQISAGSDIPVNWKCHKCGYTWRATAYDRHSGHGCAFCAGKALMRGRNDLLSQRPDIAKEWDYGKNGGLRPEDVTVFNDRIVGWICSKCGFPWPTRIADRTGKNKSGCPHCAGKVPYKGKDDFKTLYPEIAIDWDWEKNEKKPEEYRAGSDKDIF